MPIFLLSLIESEEDKISLSRIYEKYKKYLYAIALDMSNDTEIAEEALSETFLAVISVYENIKAYDSVRMKYFLRTVLRNKTIDIIRFKSKSFQYRSDLNGEIIGEADVDFDEFEQSQLVSAMISIKDEYREVLILRYVDEMDCSDISKLLNISFENTRKRIYRAKVALKNKLDEGGKQ